MIMELVSVKIGPNEVNNYFDYLLYILRWLFIFLLFLNLPGVILYLIKVKHEFALVEILDIVLNRATLYFFLLGVNVFLLKRRRNIFGRLYFFNNKLFYSEEEEGISTGQELLQKELRSYDSYKMSKEGIVWKKIFLVAETSSGFDKYPLTKEKIEGIEKDGIKIK